VAKFDVTIVKESEVGILVEHGSNIVKPMRIKKIVVIEECDQGTAGRSHALGRHGTESAFMRENPLSAPPANLSFEVLVDKIRHDHDLHWQSRV